MFCPSGMMAVPRLDVPPFHSNQSWRWNWDGLRIGSPKMCCRILGAAQEISFQLVCPKHCLCCEVARLSAVLQLAKTTWASWWKSWDMVHHCFTQIEYADSTFISHGIYDPLMFECFDGNFLNSIVKIFEIFPIIFVLQSIEQSQDYPDFSSIES